MNGSRITPPAARHLLDDAANLHRQVSDLDKESLGTAHITDPRALADTFTVLAQALDLLPTVASHLGSHLLAWRDADRLVLAEDARYEDTTAVCGAALQAIRQAMGALESSALLLRASADTLEHLAPNKPAPSPQDQDWRPDLPWTAHQRIAGLRRRLEWAKAPISDPGGLDGSWRRILIALMTTCIAEGRLSDAARVVINDVAPPARNEMAAELVAIAEIFVTVSMAQDATYKAMGTALGVTEPPEKETA